MKQMLSRLLSLFVVMFTMCLPSLAESSTYYSKTIANAVGEGKVYVSTAQSDSPAYEEGSSEAEKNEDKTSAPKHTYYLYAQANEGNEFVGWYDNAQCSGEALSTASPYIKEITADKEVANATETYYAKFRKIGIPILSYGEGHSYVNLSVGSYKNETLTTENVTETITYASSNENVATVAADGTVTAKKNGSCIITAKSGEAEASYVITVIDDVNAGITQIGNGDFEDWSNVTSSNHAPNNWNSFETAEGSMASAAGGQQVAMVEGGRPGSDGLYCVDIFCQSIFGVPANGNLTLGCINAGNITATDASNHNFSKISDPAKSETISKIPSAIKFWAKFVPNSTDYNARMAATVHDAYNYITHGQATSDTDENKAHAIAQAELNFPACEWTEITVPFVPTGNTTDGQMYIIVNFTTNETPGVGKAGDHLYIDDVELVCSDEPIPVVYNKYISVAVNNIYAAPQEASIEVTYNENSTIDFNLKNFALDNNGTPMYVGNINLPGLAIDENGNFGFNGDIRIAEGDKEGVTTWLGPNLGDIPAVLEGTIKDGYFYVHIDINVGYPVEVEVGDLANATVNVSDALISTFCAPFTVAIPADYQSVVTASTVTGVEGNVLTLEPVANYVIPANTPVIIETPVANTLPVSGIYVKGTPVAGLLTGVYENTPAPVGSYVLQNLDKVGFYQVAEGNQPTVGANRCYLTVPAAGVKAFFLNGDDATGISNVDANVDANEVIYNIAGQRINKFQKGINIINGKKILK
ncbi:MAG: Ig-like domain-containing protein [Bacteroidaceae bacterium]|nr:Ig-like domain-containing protein [Bacteroidaceae bacterium]